ncbi:hypothetical protein RCL1_000672 [Eukaryota sp. TZLM3-RCL]
MTIIDKNFSALLAPSYELDDDDISFINTLSCSYNIDLTNEVLERCIESLDIHLSESGHSLETLLLSQSRCCEQAITSHFPSGSLHIIVLIVDYWKSKRASNSSPIQVRQIATSSKKEANFDSLLKQQQHQQSDDLDPLSAFPDPLSFLSSNSFKTTCKPSTHVNTMAIQSTRDSVLFPNTRPLPIKAFKTQESEASLMFKYFATKFSDFNGTIVDDINQSLAVLVSKYTNS